jgi:arylsulfatase A-like enzyme
MVATMLDLAGARPAAPMRGHSLAAMDRHPGFAFSESHSEGNYTGSFTIRKGDWKYIYFTGDDPLLFNMKQDPGEYVNLAGRKETASVVKELHGVLCSVVDPDAVTAAAFDKQSEVLRGMVARMKRDEFIEELEGRLGAGQARVLAGRLYGKA